MSKKNKTIAYICPNCGKKRFELYSENTLNFEGMEVPCSELFECVSNLKEQISELEFSIRKINEKLDRAKIEYMDEWD